MRAALAKRYGISARNDLSILAAIGYDCPGAVSFSENEEDCGEVETPLEGEPISEDELEKHLHSPALAPPPPTSSNPP